MSVDLKSMTLPQLEKLQKKVEQAIVTAQSRRTKDALAAVEKVSKEYGVSLDELLGAKAPKAKKRGPKPGVKRGKAAPKFKNPADAAQTWTGKGRQPTWYRDAIAGGASPDDLLI